MLPIEIMLDLEVTTTQNVIKKPCFKILYRISTCASILSRWITQIPAFIIGNTFICKTKLKLIKSQAKVKQHLDAKLFQFENYLLFSSALSSKKNAHILKICNKTSLSILTLKRLLEGQFDPPPPPPRCRFSKEWVKA